MLCLYKYIKIILISNQIDSLIRDAHSLILGLFNHVTTKPREDSSVRWAEHMLNFKGGLRWIKLAFSESFGETTTSTGKGWQLPITKTPYFMRSCLQKFSAWMWSTLLPSAFIIAIGGHWEHQVVNSLTSWTNKTCKIYRNSHGVSNCCSVACRCNLLRVCRWGSYHSGGWNTASESHAIWRGLVKAQ